MQSSQLETIEGDLLKVPAGFIIHGCNAQGVMGSGVARGVKATFPAAFQAYYEHCSANPALGTISACCVSLEPKLYIINALTQQSFGAGLQVSYDAIYDSFINSHLLADFIDPARELPLCFPMIGAGRGGGDWSKILTSIHDAAKMLESPRSMKLYVVDAEPDYCR